MHHTAASPAHSHCQLHTWHPGSPQMRSHHHLHLVPCIIIIIIITITITIIKAAIIRGTPRQICHIGLRLDQAASCMSMHRMHGSDGLTWEVMQHASLPSSQPLPDRPPCKT